MKYALVLTSIHGEQPILENIRSGVLKNQWIGVVAGDTISKPIESKGSFEFLSIVDQLNSASRYAKLAPVRNYCRKNLAYLRAMQLKADVIVETDDDNKPQDTFFSARVDKQSANVIETLGFVNVYKYFTDQELIWPRGFSLADLKRKLPEYKDLSVESVYCPIQNGLVDGDPDVDAIYRLIFDLPFHFEHSARTLSLKKGTWCSFNTQNTTFFRPFFPLMYMPATPMFREADIVRSFIIQRILWENNAQLLFHSANVIQERNDHDLMDDLRQEVRLYAYIKEIAGKLESVHVRAGKEFFLENMQRCYQVFEQYGIIEKMEYKLLDAWFEDIAEPSK